MEKTPISPIEPNNSAQKTTEEMTSNMLAFIPKAAITLAKWMLKGIVLKPLEWFFDRGLKIVRSLLNEGQNENKGQDRERNWDVDINRDKQKNRSKGKELDLDIDTKSKSRSSRSGRGRGRLRNFTRSLKNLAKKPVNLARGLKNAWKFGRTARTVDMTVKGAKTIDTAAKVAQGAKAVDTAMKVASVARIGGVAALAGRGLLSAMGGPVGIAVFVGTTALYYGVKHFTRNNEEVYNEDASGVQKSNLNEKDVIDLRTVSKSSVGEIVPGASNLKLVLDGNTFLETDSDGKILANNFRGDRSLDFYTIDPKTNNLSLLPEDLKQQTFSSESSLPSLANGEKKGDRRSASNRY